MGDDVFQELQIGGEATHAELPQGAVHARGRFIRRVAPGRDLDQQRIVVRRDHGTGIGGAGVQSDTETGGAAVHADLAVIGREIVFRVFGGDAALQGMAAQADVFLERDEGVIVAHGCAFGDADLRLDDVHAGHYFGDGVLDLDTRIHFDEVVLAAVHIKQIFDGARVGVVGSTCQSQGRFAQLGAGVGVHVGRRRPLHHLLVAPLHRAVALKQMYQVAVSVAHHLDLDVAGAAHQLFQVDLVIAKGGQGLALGQLHHGCQVGLGLDHAHTAAPAAPAGLEHQRVAHFQRHSFGHLDVIGQRSRCGHHRHIRRHGHGASRHLVAQRTHHIAIRPDEGHAGSGTGVGKVRVL